MKKTKNLMAIVAMMLLVAMVSVAGTLAFLQAESKTITNTFTTAGKLAITMDETDVDVYGVKDGDTRVETNDYKLIPGHEYIKDPIIHVAYESEVCYLFVEIKNDIANIEAGTTVAAQMAANGWVKLDGAKAPGGDEYTVYVLDHTVDAREEAKNVNVFEKVTLVNNQDLSGYTTATITLHAYAVQYDGFEPAEGAAFTTGAAAAWSDTFGK